jgi:hypothetical protein
MAKKIKIISILLLAVVLGLAIFRFIWIPWSYSRHLLGLREVLQKSAKGLDEEYRIARFNTTFTLAKINSSDLEQIGQSIYFRAIPPDEFYTHYKGLKQLKKWGYKSNAIASELDFALDAYEQLLILTMVIDNFVALRATLPSDELIPLPKGMIIEGTSKQFYLAYSNRESIQKLDMEDWNWDENYDEKLKTIRKVLKTGQLPCKLWQPYILFYMQETEDNFWWKHCRACDATINAL